MFLQSFTKNKPRLLLKTTREGYLSLHQFDFSSNYFSCTNFDLIEIKINFDGRSKYRIFDIKLQSIHCINFQLIFFILNFKF